jgi:site-specific recombinase XerD
MSLTLCAHQFFQEYLPRIKGASGRTIESYRHALSLFLKFAAAHQQKSVKELQIEELTFELIYGFLNHLEDDRKNSARTRNNRLAALKSLARMIRLLYPEHRKIAEMILAVPQKRCRKRLVGFLSHDDVLKVLASVDLKKTDGFRDYTMLHLLYDSGARASEVAALTLSDFDPGKRTLAILGKGNCYRLVLLWPKTTQLLSRYIARYRPGPRVLYKDALFVNQRRERITRHGIYRICRAYLRKSLDVKQLKYINPAHSFRHSCAVNMLLTGASLTEIKNHLGHEKLESTMIYLHLNLQKKREVQKRFIEYSRSSFSDDPVLNQLMDWEKKDEILRWLDTL